LEFFFISKLATVLDNDILPNQGCNEFSLTTIPAADTKSAVFIGKYSPQDVAFCPDNPCPYLAAKFY
jgi:hypothetical protein